MISIFFSQVCRVFIFFAGLFEGFFTGCPSFFCFLRTLRKPLKNKRKPWKHVKKKNKKTNVKNKSRGCEGFPKCLTVFLMECPMFFLVGLNLCNYIAFVFMVFPVSCFMLDMLDFCEAFSTKVLEFPTFADGPYHGFQVTAWMPKLGICLVFGHNSCFCLSYVYLILGFH